MAVGNVAVAKGRSLGGLAILAAILALFAAAPAPAPASSEAALSSSKTILALSLVRASSDREVLEIRGASVGSDPTQFTAVAALSRIPCPGPYRYNVQTENQHTGALNSYSAQVALASFRSDQNPPCGGAPPSRPGALHIELRGAEETIDFRQTGPSGPGDFFGDFAYGVQPVCDQHYTLSVNADLRGWNRSARYRFKVAGWESEAQGLPLENGKDC